MSLVSSQERVEVVLAFGVSLFLVFYPTSTICERKKKKRGETNMTQLIPFAFTSGVKFLQFVLQFFYSNNLCRFLGHFQPQQGKPALWELDSDQHCDAGRNGHANMDDDGR